jgi:hypothetical protein
MQRVIDWETRHLPLALRRIAGSSKSLVGQLLTGKIQHALLCIFKNDPQGLAVAEQHRCHVAVLPIAERLWISRRFRCQSKKSHFLFPRLALVPLDGECAELVGAWH